MQGTRHDSNLAALQAGTGFPGHILDVVVLTPDSGLLATLRQASSAAHAVWHAPSADAAVDLLVGGRCGVLIADLGALRGDAAALLERLGAQFPELILLATGRREEEGAVAGLISSGTIYRFLHKPVSPARAELFLSAATRRHNELRNIEPVALTTAHTMATRPHLGRIVAAGVAALVIMTAFVLWRAQRPPSLPAAIPQQQAPAPTRDEQIADHLARAEMAFATGRLSEPRGDNALEHFRAVLALQPGRAEARTGVDRVINTLEARFTRALQARDAPQGALAWTALRRAQPDHPRLEELQAQLLAISRSMKPTLSSTPVSEPASSQLAASSRAGAATARPDPDAAPTATAQVAHASAGAGKSRIEASQAELSVASPSTEELAAIAALRERGALIEPAGGNAYDGFLALRERFPQSTQISAEQQRLAFALLESTRTALAAGDVDAAAAFVTRAEIVVPGMATTKALQEELAAARRQRDFMKDVVSAASLRRQREVAPIYPREAQRNGVEGWVDVEFTIAPDGRTQDLVVRDSQPRDVFDKSALDSVGRWRFKPVMRDGVPVAQRAALRVKFVLQ